MGSRRSRTEKRRQVEKRIITVEEVAEMIGLAPQTIRNQMSERLFPAKHKKIGRLFRFDIKEVEKYIRSLPD